MTRRDAVSYIVPLVVPGWPPALVTWRLAALCEQTNPHDVSTYKPNGVQNHSQASSRSLSGHCGSGRNTHRRYRFLW
jgi:hypothetical protein